MQIFTRKSRVLKLADELDGTLEEMFRLNSRAFSLASNVLLFRKDIHSPEWKEATDCHFKACFLSGSAKGAISDLRK